MFKYFKNLYKKDKEPEQENKEEEIEDVQSSVTYYVKPDGQIYMDIHLAEYDYETMNNFAKMISGLSSLRFQLQTVEMIKESFYSMGEYEVFDELMKKIVMYTGQDKDNLEKIIDANEREEKPWIKPSQVIN